MGPKFAVDVAKKHVLDLFGEEGITDLGLEEIELEGNLWKITIGFSRHWDYNVGSVLGGSGRTYKILVIDNGSQEVLSIKDRSLSKNFL